MSGAAATIIVNPPPDDAVVPLLPYRTARTTIGSTTTSLGHRPPLPSSLPPPPANRSRIPNSFLRQASVLRKGYHLLALSHSAVMQKLFRFDIHGVAFVCTCTGSNVSAPTPALTPGELHRCRKRPGRNLTMDGMICSLILGWMAQRR
jgi:hypothetical protein